MVFALNADPAASIVLIGNISPAFSKNVHTRRFFYRHSEVRRTQKRSVEHMAVYRVNKDRSYTVMANFHLRDKNLSLKAVGLLSKMLSFNDGWKFSTRGLSAICKEGPDAIHSALRELEKHGYLVRHRTRDDKGRMSCMVFEIYEKPQPVSPDTGKPHMENPDVDNPDMDKPHKDNPAQINTIWTHRRLCT